MILLELLSVRDRSACDSYVTRYGRSLRRHREMWNTRDEAYVLRAVPFLMRQLLRVNGEVELKVSKMWLGLKVG